MPSSDEMWLNMAASSSCAAVTVSPFNSLDCLRVRWQVTATAATSASASASAPASTASSSTPPASSGLAAFGRTIVAEEGLLRGLWLPGIVPNAVACALARGVGLGCYPSVRDALVDLRSSRSSSDRKDDRTDDSTRTSKDALTMFTAGLISGGVGYGLTNPLWLLKTRVQAGAGRVGPDGLLATGSRAGSKPVFRSDLDGLRRIAGEGLRRAYAGVSVLVVRGALMNAGNAPGYDGTKNRRKRSSVTSGQRN